MSKQINIPALRKSLREHQPATPVPIGPTPGAQYLYEHFYLPLLHEKPVTFGQLDHTRFDIDDIQELGEVYDHSEKNTQRLYRMCANLGKTEAVTKPAAFI